MDEEKRNVAAKLGCQAFDPRDAKTALRAVRKASGKKRGVQACIDFVGADPTIKMGIDAVRTGGKVVAVGLFGAKLDTSLSMLIMGQKAVVGSLTGNLEEAKELVALLRSKQVKAPPTEFRPITQANQALEDLKKGAIAGRCILQHTWSPAEKSAASL